MRWDNGVNKLIYHVSCVSSSSVINSLLIIWPRTVTNYARMPVSQPTNNNCDFYSANVNKQCVLSLLFIVSFCFFHIIFWDECCSIHPFGHRSHPIQHWPEANVYRLWPEMYYLCKLQIGQSRYTLFASFTEIWIFTVIRCCRRRCCCCYYNSGDIAAVDRDALLPHALCGTHIIQFAAHLSFPI